MRKRKGNILIVAVAFMSIIMVIGSAILSMRGQNHRQRQRAVNAGDTDSYVTIANLCADAFAFDLDSQVVELYPSVERPTGYTSDDDDLQDHFQTALTLAQTGTDGNGLQIGEADPITGKWQYKVTNPKVVFNYLGLEDADGTITALYDRLLESANMQIMVNGPLTVAGMGNSTAISSFYKNGEIVFYIDDINFSVEIKKGNLVITQEYILSNLLLVGLYDEAGNVKFDIDYPLAQYNLVKQSISRIRLGVSDVISRNP